MNIYMQGFIFVAIALGLETLVNILLVIFKPNIKIRNLKFVYAFSGGFLLITGLMGQIVPARTSLHEHWEALNEAGGKVAHGASASQTLISATIIISGILLAVGIIFFTKKMAKATTTGQDLGQHIHFEALSDQKYLVKNSKKDNKKKEKIIYNSHKETKPQLAAVYMVAAHRIPAGISLGNLIFSINYTDGSGEIANPYALANVISFIIHLIPDLLILYYGYLYSGKTRKKAIWFSLLVDTPLWPMIFAGIGLASLSANVDWLFWIPSFSYTTVGILIIWAAVGEIAVEIFSHTKEKLKYNILLGVFVLGIGASIVINLVHVH